jgi:hypothetical protein
LTGWPPSNGPLPLPAAQPIGTLMAGDTECLPGERTKPAGGRQRRVRERMTKAPPSRAGKRLISAFVEPEVLKQFKMTVLENDSTIQETLVGLINEYFRKNGKPPIAR